MVVLAPDRSAASWSSSTRSPARRLRPSRCPTITPNYYYYYPYGFSIASDGSFWIPQPNSGNIIHLDASYNEIGSYSAGGYMPESASIGTDGNVYFSTTVGDVFQLNPTNGAVNYFAYTASPFGTLTNTAPGGTGIWAADYYDGGFRYDYSGNLQQQVGLLRDKPAPDRSEWRRLGRQLSYYELFKFDQYGDRAERPRSCPARSA